MPQTDREKFLKRLKRKVARNPGDGNTGAVIPRSDVDDLIRGACAMPAEVTLARRRGQQVEFVQPDADDPKSWYWQFANGHRIKHSFPY